MRINARLVSGLLGFNSLAGLVACGSVQVSPNVTAIDGRESQYRQWYRELEECSGLKGDFDRLTFYVTTDHLRNGRTFDGYWEPLSIVLRKPYEREAVQHEMMHDLTQSNQHSKEYFNGKCGNLSRGEAL